MSVSTTSSARLKQMLFPQMPRIEQGQFYPLDATGQKTPDRRLLASVLITAMSRNGGFWQSVSTEEFNELLKRHPEYYPGATESVADALWEFAFEGTLEISNGEQTITPTPEWAHAAVSKPGTIRLA